MHSFMPSAGSCRRAHEAAVCYQCSCAATCISCRQAGLSGPSGPSCAQVGKGYAGPREALVLNSNFVLGQLRRLDAATAPGARLAESAFACALQQQARRQGHACCCALHRRRGHV